MHRVLACALYAAPLDVVCMCVRVFAARSECQVKQCFGTDTFVGVFCIHIVQPACLPACKLSFAKQL